MESCSRWSNCSNICGIHLVRSFSFTHIHLCCYISLLHSKEKHSWILFLMNIFIQQIICASLKSVIAQARPVGACSTSYGYPSGHSGFAAAVVTWLVMEILFFDSKAIFKQSKFYVWSRNALILFAPLVPTSRHYLNYHTIEQIICGAIVGTITSVIFFFLVFGTKCANYEPIIVRLMNRYKLRGSYAQDDESCINYAKEDPEHNAVTEHYIVVRDQK